MHPEPPLTRTAHAAPGRQARKTQRTRARLIEATLGLIREHGFSAATAGRIARRAGVTWGAAQYQFGSKEDILEAIRPLHTLVTSEEILRVPEVRLRTVPGFDTAVFAFTTDVPFLGAWGAPLLFGPGSILVAHTAEEYLEIDQLNRAVDAYEQLAAACLASASGLRG